MIIYHIYVYFHNIFFVNPFFTVPRFATGHKIEYGDRRTYEIKELVGYGSYGEVYRVVSRPDESIVAMKSIRIPAHGNESDIANAAREQLYFIRVIESM